MRVKAKVAKVGYAVASAIALSSVLGIDVAKANPIVPDGLGTAIEVQGNTTRIVGGTQANQNLFHSFSKFGVPEGQIAEFLSQQQIKNILARVTGGEASNIDGLMRVVGGNSHLFLLNPHGIIVGKHGAIDVAGGFTAVTGSGVKFNNGVWDLSTSEAQTKLLGGDPSGVIFNSGLQSSINNQGKISSADLVRLIGGNVNSTGTISTEQGTVTVAAVENGRYARFTPEGSVVSVDIPVETVVPSYDPNFGKVEITGDVSGAQVNVLAKNSTVDSSKVSGNLTQGWKYVFIDTTVPKPEVLEENATGGANIYRIDKRISGVPYISSVLWNANNVRELHLVAEGGVSVANQDGNTVVFSNGSFGLGQDYINSNSYQAVYQDYFKALKSKGTLSDGASILLYACNLAETPEGQQLINAIWQDTGATVYASAEKVGAPNPLIPKRDWRLEYNTAGTDTIPTTFFDSSKVTSDNYDYSLRVVDVDNSAFYYDLRSTNLFPENWLSVRVHSQQLPLILARHGTTVGFHGMQGDYSVSKPGYYMATTSGGYTTFAYIYGHGYDAIEFDQTGRVTQVGSVLVGDTATLELGRGYGLTFTPNAGNWLALTDSMVRGVVFTSPIDSADWVSGNPLAQQSENKVFLDKPITFASSHPTYDVHGFYNDRAWYQGQIVPQQNGEVSYQGAQPYSTYVGRSNGSNGMATLYRENYYDDGYYIGSYLTVSPSGNDYMGIFPYYVGMFPYHASPRYFYTQATQTNSRLGSGGSVFGGTTPEAPANPRRLEVLQASSPFETGQFKDQAVVDTAFAGTYRLKLTDYNGNPLANETVTLETINSSGAGLRQNVTVVTDANGIAQWNPGTIFANTTAGSYDVRFTSNEAKGNLPQFRFNNLPDLITTASANLSLTEAGQLNNVTITLQDKFGNVSNRIGDTIPSLSASITDTHPQAGFLAPTMTTGMDALGTAIINEGGTLNGKVRFATAGEQGIKVRLTDDKEFTATVQVLPAVVESVTYTIPDSAVAGTALPVGVELKDRYGNLSNRVGINSQNGIQVATLTVAEGSEDVNPVSMIGGDFSTSPDQLNPSAYKVLNAGGQFTVPITTYQAGTRRIDAVFNDVAESETVTIRPATASQLNLGDIPNEITAGQSFNLSVQAKDQFGNNASDYNGTLVVDGTNNYLGSPSTHNISGGAVTIPVSLVTAEGQQVKVQDQENPNLSATTTGTVTVKPDVFDKLALVFPDGSNIEAGDTVELTVRSTDKYGNPVNQNGTVSFTSTDPRAVLPENGTLTDGIGNFDATFFTAGAQQLTAESDGKGGTTTVTVKPAPFMFLGDNPTQHEHQTVGGLQLVGINGDVGKGESIVYEVQAVDAFGNPTTIYRHNDTDMNIANLPIHASSSDILAELSDGAFDANGRAAMNAVFNTTGTQTLTQFVPALNMSQDFTLTVTNPILALNTLNNIGNMSSISSGFNGDFGSFDIPYEKLIAKVRQSNRNSRSATDTPVLCESPDQELVLTVMCDMQDEAEPETEPKLSLKGVN